ncbi:MAG: type VI secretion system tube protein Hcp [Ilumatobacteraceae bacterium]
MRESWFLELDGIAGESVDDRHPGEIEIHSWSWGVASSTSGPAGGVGGAGKAIVDDFQFTTHVSSASPPLLLACANGRRIGSATLTGVRSGGAGAPFTFLTYALRDVVIASVHHGDATGGAPLEQFAVRAATVEVTYRRQLPTGAAAPAVTATVGVGKGR